MLTNRVARLKFEETRAKKEIKRLKQKASDFVSVRDKYYQDRKRILNYQLKLENDTNSKRQQMNIERENHKKRMDELKQSLLDTRLKRKERQKTELKEALMQKSSELESAYRQLKSKTDLQKKTHLDKVAKINSIDKNIKQKYIIDISILFIICNLLTYFNIEKQNLTKF